MDLSTRNKATLFFLFLLILALIITFVYFVLSKKKEEEKLLLFEEEQEQEAEEEIIEEEKLVETEKEEVEKEKDAIVQIVDNKVVCFVNGNAIGVLTFTPLSNPLNFELAQKNVSLWFPYLDNASYSVSFNGTYTSDNIPTMQLQITDRDGQHQYAIVVDSKNRTLSLNVVYVNKIHRGAITVSNVKADQSINGVISVYKLS
jgi:hypothetical protein